MRVNKLDVVSVNNMRLSDKYTIDNYIDSKLLMYRAAYGIFLASDYKDKKIAIVTGKGNNAGDGYALAYIFEKNNISYDLIMLDEKKSTDGLFFYDKLINKGCLYSENINFDKYDVTIDCLFGTGFSGEVKGNYKAVIEKINSSNSYVISADINSGNNGDTGLSKLCVKANLVVAIGFIKEGLLINEYVKRIVVNDIGIKLLEKENEICVGEYSDKVSFDVIDTTDITIY